MGCIYEAYTGGAEKGLLGTVFRRNEWIKSGRFTLFEKRVGKW